MFGLFVALGQHQAKQSYGAGLLALGGSYIPIGLLVALDRLQKRSGLPPLRAWVRWVLMLIALTATPLVWAASCWVVPASAPH